jgi:hypothetical protein
MRKQQLDRAVKRRLEEVKTALAVIPDETAAESVDLFLSWGPNERCERGDRLKWQGKLYRVEQTHISQPGWEPPNVPALFTEIPKPGEIPVWRQPTGAQDAYMQGDKVHFPNEGDPVYVSNVDNNVWQPGVYGWELAT